VRLLAWLLWVLQTPVAPVLPTAMVAPFYRITHYCSCQVCTGPRGPKPTKSGRWPVEGLTVAADRDLHPLGSYVTIQGLGRFRVDDTGSAIKGRRLDVYVGDHERARRLGVKWRRVR
jgi:3D (Asp-Asp-Asp) domain-containing protein